MEEPKARHLCVYKEQYEPTNYLTAWSTFMLEKQAVPQLLKEFPASYGTPITAFTTARHLFLSYARSL
jgi:hypothetical protein